MSTAATMFGRADTAGGDGGPPSPLLSTTKAADLLGVSPRTLEDWRLKGGGPLFRKLGARLVRYALGDLQAFIEGAARSNTGCAAA